jgi:hypothetical protein
MVIDDDAPAVGLQSSGLTLYEGAYARRMDPHRQQGVMMIRSTLPILYVLTALVSGASAQGLGIDPNSLRPTFRLPLQGGANADTYRRLPYQDLASEIRIELAADVLYDFDTGVVRSGAADYFQQAANLIFEEAKGPVRIECSSDRAPPAIGQKLAERCASAIAQWMIVQEKLTKGLSINNSVTFVFWRGLCRAAQSCSSSRHGRRDGRD